MHNRYAHYRGGCDVSLERRREVGSQIVNSKQMVIMKQRENPELEPDTNCSPQYSELKFKVAARKFTPLDIGVKRQTAIIQK